MDCCLSLHDELHDNGRKIIISVEDKTVNIKRGSLVGCPAFSCVTTVRLKQRQWTVSHAAGRAQCRQKCCESGYYHLHRHLNKTILLHTLLLTSAISLHYSLFFDRGQRMDNVKFFNLLIF